MRHYLGPPFLLLTTDVDVCPSGLDGTAVQGRNLVVRPANPRSDPAGSSRLARPVPTALTAGSRTQLSLTQKEQKIQELERQLQKIEGSSKEEFKVRSVPSTSLSSARSQQKPYSKPKS